MPDAKLLQEILEARYEYDCADKGHRADRLKRLNRLLDQAIEGKNISRYELLTALFERYKEFKASQRRQEQVRLSRRIRE